MAKPNMDTPSCPFGSWEVNHDINSSRCPECLPKSKQEKPEFKKLLYTMIPGCDSGTRYIPDGWLSDEKCVETIFGSDIKKAMSDNTSPYNAVDTNKSVNIKTKTADVTSLNVTCVDPSKPGDIYKCFTTDIPGLDIKTAGEVYDVFLFIDTAQQTLKYLSRSNIGNNPPQGDSKQLNVHYMTSCLSLADSATQTSPEGKQFKGGVSAVNDLRCYLYSWYNSTTRKVGPPGADITNPEIYSTHYSVTTQPFIGQGIKPYKMQQTWVGGFGDDLKLDQTASRPRIVIQDTNKNFSVPAIARSDLKTKLDIAMNAIKNNDSSQKGIINDVALSVAGKKSGDHLQIKDIADFISDFNLNDWLLVRGFFGGPHNVRWDTGQKTFDNFVKINPGLTLAGNVGKLWRKNRSFFVTIDWPALAWALYNEINVIFLYLGAGGVKKLIRFIFNQ